MAFKKKPQNKTEKKVVENKTPSVDWALLPMMVDIEFNGKTVNTHKSNARLLVEKGVAKLK